MNCHRSNEFFDRKILLARMYLRSVGESVDGLKSDAETTNFINCLCAFVNTTNASYIRFSERVAVVAHP